MEELIVKMRLKGWHWNPATTTFEMWVFDKVMQEISYEEASLAINLDALLNSGKQFAFKNFFHKLMD